MSTTITNVVNTSSIITAEFVKLTVVTTSSSTVYTFSSSYRHETIAGQDYTPLGGLLSVGTQQKDIRATSYDTAIGLTGVDPNNIYLVLGTPIRGSQVEILRGFYSTDYQLTNTVLRFTGLVKGYTIKENRQGQDDIFDVVLTCSSSKSILENNTSGRRTNHEQWFQEYGTNDTSMDNVAALNGAYFNFGLPVTAKPAAPATVENNFNSNDNNG